MPKRRSFIVRIWRTDSGDVIGQISDPEEGVRRPFRDVAELWQLLLASLGQRSASGETPHPPPTGATRSEEET